MNGQGFSFTRVLIFSIFAVAISCLLVGGAEAAPRSKTSFSSYKSARAYYNKLLKTDPHVHNLIEWERAASNLLAYVESSKNNKDVPRAMYSLGKLYERTYRERQFRTGLSRAVYFYERLARDYRGHYLADDALLHLGDLRRYAQGDEVAARAAYFEIVDRYPSADMYSKARRRLGLDKPQPKVSSQEATSSVKTNKLAEEKAISDLKLTQEVPKAPKTKKSGILGIFGSKREKSREVYAKGRLNRRPVIVIDPGHGGEDLGAHGPKGIFEKDVTLNIAMYLDELLRERLRAKTVLTRARDVVIPLEERTGLANKEQADLFISIHANASPRGNARGIETYYLDNTADKQSLRLAELENKSVVYGGSGQSDLSFIVSDLIQSAKQDDSIALAHYIHDALKETLGRYYKGVKSLGVKKAPFYVLMGAHMPCVLSEVSFLDHPTEGQRLITRRYQKLIAEAMYRGIRDYFERR